MNKTLQEAKQFVEQLLPQLEKLPTSGPTIWIAPAFVHLSTLQTALMHHPCVQLAAQNCHHESAGAYTGEVSVSMLASAGVAGVLVGHSERRLYQKETDAMIAQKVKQILETGMQPLFCCGERLEDRTAGTYKRVLKQQLLQGLATLSSVEATKLIVAYEPVWAIGTGQVASLEIITEAHTFIRTALVETYGTAAAATPILYGGSCTAQNAAAVFACPNVAGGLIGGASLEADHFIQLIQLLRGS